MPKSVKKPLRQQRNLNPYTVRKSKSDSSFVDKAQSLRYLQKEHNTLLAEYESEKKLAENLELELQRVKETREDVKCDVCLSPFPLRDLVYMGDCGHGACRPCFVNSVAHSAVQIRQQQNLNTISTTWRCFTCRQMNDTYVMCNGDRIMAMFISPDPSMASELGEEVVEVYRAQEEQLQLPPAEEEDDDGWPTPDILQAMGILPPASALNPPSISGAVVVDNGGSEILNEDEGENADENERSEDDASDQEFSEADEEPEASEDEDQEEAAESEDETDDES